MNRDDYRAVKKMSRTDFTAYMERIYLRGYKKGQEDALGIESSPGKKEEPDTPAE